MTLNLHQCIMLNKLNISFSNLHFYFTRPHVMVFHVTSKLVIQVYDLNHKLRIECYQLRGKFPRETFEIHVNKLKLPLQLNQNFVEYFLFSSIAIEC